MGWSDYVVERKSKMSDIDTLWEAFDFVVESAVNGGFDDGLSFHEMGLKLIAIGQDMLTDDAT